ncbi:MAG: suppressor of fused domain protein, partial [Succinivibrio sp.]
RMSGGVGGASLNSPYSIMDKTDFLRRKVELKEQVDTLYKDNELFKVIALLENSELDFELCMLLVRTYINAANRTSDPYSLYQKAQVILDNFAIEGKTSACYQFYQGYILFKQGLTSDSLIRFEQALKFAHVEDGVLFANICTMIENAKRELRLSEFKPLPAEDRNELLAFIRDKFGEATHLCSLNRIDLYHIAPTEAHDYNMIVSVGLSAKDNLNHEHNQGSDLVEVCLTLPSEYRFDRDNKNCFEIFMLIEIINFMQTETNPLGFGYYLEKEGGFSKRTAFNGAMLVSLGDFPKESQNVTLASGRIVNFYELIPLRPMELAYRKEHSATDLLNLFKEKLVKLTPFISSRDDVCQRFEM